MTSQRDLTRRTVLLAGAAGSGALLAACSSSGSGSAAGPTTRKADVGQPAATAPSAAAPSTEATAASAADDSSGGADDSSGTVLTTLTDIKVGHAVSVKLPGGGPGVVSRVSANQAACFSAVCPHMGCTVAPGDSTFSCPCHGSQFDLRTGAVRQGPATSGLAKIAVSVSDGQVVAAT